jgi:predicted unusual protein kinase regulating ubiquinone biosynthesis (AarF/ABC1/UbiB family)
MNYWILCVQAALTISSSTYAFVVPISRVSSHHQIMTRLSGTSTSQLLATTTEPDTTQSEGLSSADPLQPAKSHQLSPQTDDLMSQEFMKAIELEAERAVQEIIDETCEIDEETGGPKDELCVDDVKREGFRARTKKVIRELLQLVGSSNAAADMELDENASEGEVLERGWELRANSSSIVRNAEVWKFALASVFRVLKPRKMKAKGASEEELKKAQTEAAEFIRDGLLKLGPSFVKLGQVISTRTDVLPPTYTDVLKTLTDDVPGFSGERAKEIVEKELGKPVDQVFTDFSAKPLKAASLGQVHTATYKGQKVAIKVQRSGLKELFDIDLKNLKKLAVLLDKFDPKTDGADRNWVSIYEESERLLYLEIDYLNEADNTDRFAKDSQGYDWVRIPKVIREVTTPRLLVMEFVESFKLTDIEEINRNGLDRKVISKRVADAFLRQIVETGYFHADPHSGNLCVDKKGNLVYYDYGMMDELGPNVKAGFRKFCTALFAGGPKISDIQLAQNAKELVAGVEQAGVLAKGADRLAVEKLARYFMRAFKDKQLGKSSGNIKQTIGTDLQTLTENNVFRFPSTFTFIFRAFASVDGIGKELDKDFDIGKLAQPFIEDFTESSKKYKSEADKNFQIFGKATGLNVDDIETAIMQPKKVAYIEETMRSMEDGTLKIRTRSLENEKALERVGLRQGIMENVLLGSLFFNMAGLASRTVFRTAGIVGASFFLFQALMANAKVKKFDKTQAKFSSSGSFVEDNKNTKNSN